MTLAAKEKRHRRWQRLFDNSRQYTTGTYLRKFVAPLFQRMIRAECAAEPRPYGVAVVNGELTQVPRRIGQCVCVTCGRVDAWNGRQIQTGHYLASRRNSILLNEDNVAPQCAACNGPKSGAPESYTMWMVAIRGQHTVDRLRRLKQEVRQFTRHDLIDLRLHYDDRLKAAVEKMQ